MCLRLAPLFACFSLLACGGASNSESSATGDAESSAASEDASSTEGDASSSESEATASSEASTDETGDETGNLPSRSFALGFTPFPFDLSETAVDQTYELLATDGDLYAFHTTAGVPWVEAANDADVDGYGAHLQATWMRHRAEMDAHPDHRVYLGLTPLDDSRSRLADYWAQDEHLPLPAPWDSYAFDAPEVKAAYLSHCRRAIEFYEPDYLAIGLEVNLILEADPADWPALRSLLSDTYTALKVDYPDLPIFSSVTAVDLLEGWTGAERAAQQQLVAELLEFSDHLALSFYPYMSAYSTNELPADTFAQLAALAGEHTMAIVESGYPAQLTELPGFNLQFEGTPAKQADWIELLLDQAEQRDMPFVVNFVARDYDALWSAVGGGDELAIWRDTGLFDENGDVRPALESWRDALMRPLVQP